MAVIAVGILIFCDHREQKFSTLMVERGVLGFPKHNLAPSSKNKRRDICLSAFHVEKAREIDPFGYAGFDPSGKIRLTL